LHHVCDYLFSSFLTDSYFLGTRKWHDVQWRCFLLARQKCVTCMFICHVHVCLAMPVHFVLLSLPSFPPWSTVSVAVTWILAYTRASTSADLVSLLIEISCKIN
jgi:hypothetical protein